MAGNWNTVETKIEKMLRDGKLLGKDEDGFFQDLEGPSRPIDRFSSGFFLLDYIVGGGWPRGRIIEVMGPESSGKTTLVLQTMAEAQRVFNARCVFFDYEHAFDPNYASDLGMRLGKPDLIFSQPRNMEQGFAVLKVLIEQDLCDIVVWDTVAASRSKAELDRDPGLPPVPGIHSLHFAAGIVSVVEPLATSHVTAFFVNQLRSQISTGFGGGGQDITTGGRALKFYASVRLDVRRQGQTLNAKDEDTVLGSDTRAYGQNVRFKVYKNKTAPPFREASMSLIYGKGFDEVGSVIEQACKIGVIKKGGGGNFELPNGKKIRGTEELKKLFSTPSLLDALKRTLTKEPIDGSTDSGSPESTGDAGQCDSNSQEGSSESGDEGRGVDKGFDSTIDRCLEDEGSSVGSVEGGVIGDGGTGEVGNSANGDDSDGEESGDGAESVAL